MIRASLTKQPLARDFAPKWRFYDIEKNERDILDDSIRKSYSGCGRAGRDSALRCPHRVQRWN